MMDIPESPVGPAPDDHGPRPPADQAGADGYDGSSAPVSAGAEELPPASDATPIWDELTAEHPEIPGILERLDL